MKRILLAILIALPAQLFAQSDPNMGIIPAPVSVKKDKGDFKITPETIVFADSPDSKAVRFLQNIYVNRVMEEVLLTSTWLIKNNAI